MTKLVTLFHILLIVAKGARLELTFIVANISPKSGQVNEPISSLGKSTTSTFVLITVMGEGKRRQENEFTQWYY